MVEREPGAVYFNSRGQTICVCYGAITENAKINQFGRVLQEDFSKLQTIGELVYQQTVANENKVIVGVEVSLIGGDDNWKGNEFGEGVSPRPSHSRG